MPTTLITRNSTSAGNQPTPGTVVVGELCVNVADGTLWTSSDGSDIVPVVGGTGSGDLPNGTISGQTLRWTQEGSPTWSVSDDLSIDDAGNTNLGGPSFGAGYKLTVNGAVAITDDVLCGNVVGTAGSFNSVAVNSDPSTNNQVARKSYLDATYAPKSTTVTTNTNQTISGTKTFNSGKLKISGVADIGSMSSSSSTFVMCYSGSSMFKGPFVASAAAARGALVELANILGASPTQVSTLETYMTNNGLPE